MISVMKWTHTSWSSINNTLTGAVPWWQGALHTAARYAKLEEHADEVKKLNADLQQHNTALQKRVLMSEERASETSSELEKRTEHCSQLEGKIAELQKVLSASEKHAAESKKRASEKFTQSAAEETARYLKLGDHAADVDKNNTVLAARVSQLEERVSDSEKLASENSFELEQRAARCLHLEKNITDLQHFLSESEQHAVESEKRVSELAEELEAQRCRADGLDAQVVCAGGGPSLGNPYHDTAVDF